MRSIPGRHLLELSYRRSLARPLYQSSASLTRIRCSRRRCCLPHTMAEPEPCQVCSQPSTAQCSRCKFARYCSQEHSASDWKRHKRECPILAGGIDNQVGYPLKVKGVVFPVEGGPPRMVDIPYKLAPGWMHEHIPSHELDLSTVFGRPGVATSRTRIEIAGYHSGTPLGHRLTLIHNDNFIAEDRPVNRCIHEIHQGRGYKWCDYLAAVRNVDKEDRVLQYQDITPQDVAAVVRYFEQGGDGHAALAPEQQAADMAMVEELRARGCRVEFVGL
ncbi:hypothetical protein C8Q76DRAFT_729703 [Earliella scabrosa]|nr:hypothetical protein C8Q76DRAFT_729703 [Earliella scabrosa]